MTLNLGSIAPNFTAQSSKGTIQFHNWIGDSWAFFFSHPGDFTPVCTTEMGRTAQLVDEFGARNVKPIGLSTDGIDDHEMWIEDINDTQNTTLNYPIIADRDMVISEVYGMIHSGESTSQTVRTVFIIDPDKKIRLTMTYPMNVGRNFDEILRVIDALQLADKHTIATPADWMPGEQVIIPLSVSDEKAKEKFPQGFETIRPYLRKTIV